MDNFMDKLAQRFNAQEIIKANSHAEAQEMGRLREQLRAYDECLQEMRRLNLKNVEMTGEAQQLMKQADVAAQQANAQTKQLHTLTEQMSQLTDQALSALKEERGRDNEKLDEALKKLQEELTKQQQAVQEREEKLSKTCEQLSEAGSGLEELVHKECVKVYRNVQAVLTDELKNQSKELTDSLTPKPRSRAGLYVLLVLTLLASLGSLGVSLAQLFGIL